MKRLYGLVMVIALLAGLSACNDNKKTSTHSSPSPSGIFRPPTVSLSPGASASSTPTPVASVPVTQDSTVANFALTGGINQIFTLKTSQVTNSGEGSGVTCQFDYSRSHYFVSASIRYDQNNQFGFTFAPQIFTGAQTYSVSSNTRLSLVEASGSSSFEGTGGTITLGSKFTDGKVSADFAQTDNNLNPIPGGKQLHIEGSWTCTST
jgi:hypothetical protein